MAEDLVEGQTAAIEQQLLLSGATFNGTGMTIELLLYDRTGYLAPTSGDAAWSTAATSKARYTPDAGDFVESRSPYFARWKVTNGAEIAFFPQGEPDRWTVRR